MSSATDAHSLGLEAQRAMLRLPINASATERHTPDAAATDKHIRYRTFGSRCNYP